MATHAGRRLPGSSGACYAYPRSIWKTSSTPPSVPLQGGTMSGCFPPMPQYTRLTRKRTERYDFLRNE